jgi:predicted GNAT superfamily acetyltransferase
VAQVGASHLLLEIPRAFQDLKARDPKLALVWRTAARDAFERAFAEGYAAVEFLRSADGRCAYLLVPQPREGGAGAQPLRGTGVDLMGAEPP